MATATTSKTDTGISFEVEEDVPKRNRGRQVDAETQAIVKELEKSAKDGKARSFKNVEEDDRETWARKVRSAARRTLNGKGMAVNTVYDPDQKKLFWGPSNVIKTLQNKGESAAS